MKKIRVLHIVGTMDCGGQETFIMTLFRNIDREKFEFNFLEYGDKEYYYNDEIRSLGGNIYRVKSKGESFIGNIKETFSLFRKEKFDIIHIPSYEATCSINLFLALICGIKSRIVHSHSILGENLTTNKILRPVMNMLSTSRLACSEVAGKSLFKNAKFTVVNNAIDFDKFEYASEKREHAKTLLNIKDELVLCHIGRFNIQKNHTFLLKTFKELLKKNENSRLLLAGDGELLDETKSLAKNLQIEDKIDFLGVRSDTENILFTSDIMVFPSISEGLGIALIEAQSTGLPCITSLGVPKSADITNTVTFLPTDDTNIWVENILKIYNENKDRKSPNEILANSGYSAKEMALQMEDIYVRDI